MALRIGTVAALGLDSALVAAFYKAHWPRKIALSEMAFYDWQFRSVPSAPAVDNCVVAYDSESCRLAGVMGLNARRFSLAGEWKAGAELTTWIVSDEYRGVGAGPRILEHIQKSYDVVIGMGISAAALPVYMRYGFRYLRGIPRFVRVFDIEALASVSKVTPLGRKLAKMWLPISPGLRYVAVKGMEGNADRVFECARKYLNLFTRDEAHLRWRYSEHPAFDYETFCITISEYDCSVIVCLRAETGIDGVRVMHVLDCFGDERAVPVALSFVESYCVDNGFHAVDFFCTAARINRSLLSAGWFSTLDDECFQMSHLFHPVELRTPPTTSLIYWSRDGFDEMCDLSRLYITKQDADLDRPILSREIAA